MNPFSNVTTWVFDLDNTLYPPSARLFDQIQTRMTEFIMDLLSLSEPEAQTLRRTYWQTHGTTLNGLMREHDMAPEPFLSAVHDISLDHLAPDEGLRSAIAALPGRKIIFTNGSRRHAERVSAARGLSDSFDAVYSIEDTGFHPKPEPHAYAQIFGKDPIDPVKAAMFEDEARNLEVPHRLGLRTVHVGPPTEAPYIHASTPDLTGFLSHLTRTLFPR